MPKESIAETAHVVCSLERVWKNSTLLDQEDLAAMPQHHGKMWVFRRCIVNGILFHSKSYKRVVARNDYTVECYHKDTIYYGSIHTYVKVEEKCLNTMCNRMKTCYCALSCKYYAILEVLDIDDEQLPKYRGRKVVDHIIRVKASNRCVKCSLFLCYQECLDFGIQCVLQNIPAEDFITHKCKLLHLSANCSSAGNTILNFFDFADFSGNRLQF